MNRKFVFACIIALFVLLILTNPSEEKHLQRIDDEYFAQEVAHVESCKECQLAKTTPTKTVLDRKMLADLGYERTTYFLFSAMSPDKGRISTFGVMGIVWVSEKQKVEYVCPTASAAKIPTTDPVDYENAMLIRMSADRSFRYNDRPLSFQELQALLRKIENKEDISIVLQSSEDLKIRDVTKAQSWIMEQGFSQVIFEAKHEDPGGP